MLLKVRMVLTYVLYVLNERRLKEVSTKGFCPLHSDSPFVMTLKVYNGETFESQDFTPYSNVYNIITIAVQPQKAESESGNGPACPVKRRRRVRTSDIPDLRAILPDSPLEAQSGSQSLPQRRKLQGPVAIGWTLLCAGTPKWMLERSLLLPRGLRERPRAGTNPQKAELGSSHKQLLTNTSRSSWSLYMLKVARILNEIGGSMWKDRHLGKVSSDLFIFALAHVFIMNTFLEQLLYARPWG